MNKKRSIAVIAMLAAAVAIFAGVNRYTANNKDSGPVSDNRPPTLENGLSVSGNEPTPIGGQKDEHGCLSGAGYSWCDKTESCIRSWETYCTAAAPKAAQFDCKDGKIIKATFYPSDDKYVDLVLSDERALSVPRAISASGARYAKADESFVFWNKGNTAFITEMANETTYADCVTKAE